jgi:hypothetical protein
VELVKKKSRSENDAIDAVNRTLRERVKSVQGLNGIQGSASALKGRLLISSPAKDTQISTESAIQFSLGKEN